MSKTTAMDLRREHSHKKKNHFGVIESDLCLFPLERLIFDTRLVAGHSFYSNELLCLVEKPCIWGGIWKEDDDDERPNYSRSPKLWPHELISQDSEWDRILLQ